MTPSQARLAFDQLDGTLSHALAAIGEALFDLRVRLEASLDFPDEGYHFVEPGAVGARVRDVRAQVRALLATARRGPSAARRLPGRVAGAPNVGKSLLFNALLGSGRAIVTPVAGTTRDLLTERCDIGGLAVTLIDTAGLRESDEPIEHEGIARARRRRRRRTSASWSSIDRGRSSPTPAGQRPDGGRRQQGRPAVAWSTEEEALAIAVSALTGEGLDRVRRHRRAAGRGGRRRYAEDVNARHHGAARSGSNPSAAGRGAGGKRRRRGNRPGHAAGAFAGAR